MSRLSTVQHGLAKVRRFRSTVRLGSALAVFATGLLWTLAAAFLLDYLLRMGRLERGIVLLATIAAGVWSYRRFVRPAVATREDAVTLALQVEKRQGLSSDLVAALQFADGARPQFGSTDLREAVIDYTDEVSRHFNFLEGFSRRELLQRAGLFAATLVLLVLPAGVWAEHSGAFLNRFFLGSAHYPTNTLIRAITAPGARAAHGKPVLFEVRIEQRRGARPATGLVQLQALSSGLATTIDLHPDPARPDVYTGQLARALDDLSYTVRIGDAYSEPAVVKLIPLPMVKVDLQVTVPAYARDRFSAEGEGPRQRLVLEGSRVVPVVSADKRLTAVTMTLAGQAHALRAQGDRFVLDSPQSPLAAISETTRYELQVTDEDGLSLESPIVGLVQVRPDQPPRIGAAAICRLVLPTAVPTVKFLALDDFGLARVVLHRTVTRADGQTEDATQEIARLAQHPGQFGQKLEVDLAPLNLNPGDRVSLTLEAIDYRGDLPGKGTRSESIQFQVTDRAGVIDAMREFNEQLDRKFDDIIKAQLGLGG